MNELESLMKQWQPRRPSERVARQIFGTARPEPRPVVARRRMEFWSWLTPVAACALTLLVAVGSTYRADSLGGKGATAWVFNPSSSNFSGTVLLTEMDENVQWNVCPVLTPTNAGTKRATATNVSLTF